MRQLLSEMENASLPSTDWDNVTTASLEDDKPTLNLFYSGDLALKVIYSIIGSVGIVGNLFVILVFVFFIKKADKVL